MLGNKNDHMVQNLPKTHVHKNIYNTLHNVKIDATYLLISGYGLMGCQQVLYYLWCLVDLNFDPQTSKQVVSKPFYI